MPKRKFVEHDSTQSDILVPEQLAKLFESNPGCIRPQFRREDLAGKKITFQAIDVKGVLDNSGKNWQHKLSGIPENIPKNAGGGVPVVHAYGVRRGSGAMTTIFSLLRNK